MAQLDSETLGAGYTGWISENWQAPDFLDCLSAMDDRFNDAERVVSEGRNRISVMTFPVNGEEVVIAVKRFAVQSPMKDRHARQRGSKAQRTWKYAEHLTQHDIGTPEPVAAVEKWEGDRLIESYYLSRLVEPVSSFRDELIYLYHDHPYCAPLMTLMETVAVEIRRMHDAGFYHRDLGNQNIMMTREGKDQWGEVMFIDLNRGGLREAITLKERAFDISRIALPSDFLRVFIEMYWQDVPPDAFLKAESRFRKRFDFHTRTRYLRHPLRKKPEPAPGERDYPAPRDIWIWDERSAQPIVVMQSSERKKYYPSSRLPDIASATLRAMPAVKKRYKELLGEAFTKHVVMANTIGVAVNPRKDRDLEKHWLNELGVKLPVVIRFYHHQSQAEWDRGVSWLKTLKHDGHQVNACLVQDRKAVLAPDRWSSFVQYVIDEIHEDVEWIEVGHAINRVKWGLWEMSDYAQLADPVLALRKKYPSLKLIGPAAIDFEYPYTLAALKALPGDAAFHAVGHHLYVDRRGAPENKQGPYNALDKFALGKAVADYSPVTGNRFIVSEVNWPLLDTGVYSPVGAPYVSPGPRYNDPSVSEEDYAVYMVRYLALAVCSGLVHQVFWWRLAAHGYGLVDDLNPDEWRGRPAFAALKLVLKYLGQSRFIKRHACGDQVWVLEFEAGDNRHFLGWAHPAPQTIELPTTCSSGLSVLNDAQAGPLTSVTLTGTPVIYSVEPHSGV